MGVEGMSSYQEMRIAEDGTWYWEGREMFRLEIVQLFSTHLCRTEDGNYYISWNNQTHPVVVEDAPFFVKAVYPGENDFMMLLSDGRELPMPEGDIVLKNGKPYVTLKWPLDTKLSRGAFWQLSPYMRQRDDGGYEVNYKGKTWRIVSKDLA